MDFVLTCVVIHPVGDIGAPARRENYNAESNTKQEAQARGDGEEYDHSPQGYRRRGAARRYCVVEIL